MVDPELSVVAPIFNEADNLRDLHQELTQTLSKLNRPYEIILVDDGSTDGSAPILEELAGADPAVRVILFRRNFGQTAALAAGFDHARGSIIVALDADLQNDPADIPKLLEALDGGADVVSGWRQTRHDPWLTRRFPSQMRR